MGDKGVDLVESAGIEKQLKTIARCEFPALALGIYPSLPAAKKGLFSSYFEFSPFVARLFRLVRTGVGNIGRDCRDLRVSRGDSGCRIFR